MSDHSNQQWSNDGDVDDDDDDDDDETEEEKVYDNDNDMDKFSFNEEIPELLQYVDWNNNFLDLIDQMDITIEPMNEELKQRILSMRYQLIKENYVLRASYKGYSFHKYRTNNFERKSTEYIEQTNIYRLIQKININRPTVSQQCLMNIVLQVQTTFDDLLSSDCITSRQYEQMQFNRLEVELSYLYFALDIKKEEIYTIRPIIICNHTPTMGISRYLSRILWCIFDQVTCCQTFSNGAKIVQTFKLYSINNYLQPTTLFVTFNIHEFCQKFQYDIMIKALEYFLSSYGTKENMKGLSMKTIIQLVQLVLENQFFVYRNKLYQQIIGGISGSPLTIPLACIYICYCQPDLMIALIEQNHQNELFGRFRDHLFFTWNRSEEQLRLLFDRLPITKDHQYRSIQLIPSIGTTFHFLDVELSHQNGILHTKMYHDPVIDQYELSNKLKYGILRPSKLLQSILIYAVRCCSNEESFHYERRYIKLIYLIYGFSIDFIDNCIQQFYKQFQASEIHYLIDTIPFETLRQRVMKYYLALFLLKKQWYTDIEDIQCIPYSNYSDRLRMDYFKHHFLNLLQKCFAIEPEFNGNEIDIEPKSMHDNLSSMNNYLKKQKPSRHLLTLLPKKERHRNK